MRTSDMLHVGEVYTREWLANRFQIQDRTLNTGVFRPKGHSSVWLFVTETKTVDRTPYQDRLDGTRLYWQGQTTGRTDRMIVDHAADGFELVVFHRMRKYEHGPGAGFRFEGPFQYLQHHGSRPASFVLERLNTADTPVAKEFLQAVSTLRQWRRGDTVAPHKPLLVLLALTRVQRRLPRLSAFAEVEQPLRGLIELTLPGRRGQPDYPFWCLQHDGVWEVLADGPLRRRSSNKDVSARVLRDAGAVGGFLTRFHDALADDATLVEEAGAIAARRVPTERRTAVLEALGWRLSRVAEADVLFDRRYAPVDPDVLPARARPSQRDPDVYGRGLAAHRRTQTKLAEFLVGHDIEPRSPIDPSAAFDLLWRAAGKTYVAEVKSLTATNEERQLRIGLGQVLRYRQALGVAGEPAVAVLVAERRPVDCSWEALCDEVGVVLTWPATFGRCLNRGP